MSPITVLIADDDARTRASIRAALEAKGEFVICAETADASGAVATAIRERPAVCLVDINMPGNGIAATKQIIQSLPETAVVILTVSRHDTDLFDALRAGASGYLLKDTGYERLGAALRQVLAGEAVLPGSLVARLVAEFRDREQRRIALGPDETTRLTAREWDVLELMRAGLNTGGIADRLFISATTVRSHISSILRKLKVANRAAAIHLLDKA